MGCDLWKDNSIRKSGYFNPRTHRGVQLISKIYFPLWDGFQSTHPSWGATCGKTIVFAKVAISIHAPIVGCDLVFCLFWILNTISIHAPIVGCDSISILTCDSASLFQSTHPSWGATRRSRLSTRYYNISIHAPIVGCDPAGQFMNFLDNFISIHAPIVGCDKRMFVVLICTVIFQSTHPSWGATGF